jgi:uncharacterized protein with GYD domain
VGTGFLTGWIGGTVPTYLVLCTWTEQGRREVASVPERATGLGEFMTEEIGAKVLGHYITLGRYDEACLIELPDDGSLAQFLLFVGSRGYVSTETLRCFSINELRDLI